MREYLGERAAILHLFSGRGQEPRATQRVSADEPRHADHQDANNYFVWRLTLDSFPESILGEIKNLEEIGRRPCLNKWKRSQAWQIARTWQNSRKETSTMARKRWMLRAVAHCECGGQRASRVRH